MQLKQSLEASKDPIPAGDFHFAAMEMKLAQAREKGRRGRALALWFYKILSGYGERPVRAFVFWLLGVLGFGLLFAWLGDWSIKETVGFWDSLEPALRYAFHHALPFKLGQWNQTSSPETITLTGPWWIWWLSGIETILLTAQFAFFVLALRRRFKR